MKIVTANRLDDGAVVYLAEEDCWTDRLHEAARFSDDDAELVLAAVSLRVREIAGAYLVSVDNEGALNGRDALRETIRQSGPTVLNDPQLQTSAHSQRAI